MWMCSPQCLQMCTCSFERASIHLTYACAIKSLVKRKRCYWKAPVEQLKVATRRPKLVPEKYVRIHKPNSHGKPVAFYRKHFMRAVFIGPEEKKPIRVGQYVNFCLCGEYAFVENAVLAAILRSPPSIEVCDRRQLSPPTSR